MRLTIINEVGDDILHHVQRSGTDDRHDFTCLCDVVDAVGEAIADASPKARRALSRAIAAWSHDCPDEFGWALGPQAPVLLHNLLTEIDLACRPRDGEVEALRAADEANKRGAAKDAA
jgi:hypothetical protein